MQRGIARLGLDRSRKGGSSLVVAAVSDGIPSGAPGISYGPRSPLREGVSGHHQRNE
jgi:hypothetical protein